MIWKKLAGYGPWEDLDKRWAIFAIHQLSPTTGWAGEPVAYQLVDSATLDPLSNHYQTHRFGTLEEAKAYAERTSQGE